MDKIYKSEPEEISAKEILLKYEAAFNYIRKRTIIILFCGILGGVLGLLYAFLKKPVYTAVCTFVLDDNKSGALSQYAGLASAAGIDLGGGGGTGGVFAGDNIMELYRSRNMISKALLTPVNVNGNNQLLIDRYINALKLRDRWKKKDDIDSVSFNIASDKFNRRQDSLLIDICTAISTKMLSISKLDKKLNVIKVEDSFIDELFAKCFNDRLVSMVNDFYIKTKTLKEQKNVDVLRNQVDSVKAILNSSIGSVASSYDAAPNANPLMSVLRVPSQRKQIDVQASTAVYAELIKNLELSKISLRQEMPLIQVIDQPIFPLTQSKPNKILSTISGFFVGTVLACVLILLLFWGDRNKHLKI